MELPYVICGLSITWILLWLWDGEPFSSGVTNTGRTARERVLLRASDVFLAGP